MTKKKEQTAKKCSRESYCWAMSEKAEMDPNSRSKGLSELRLMNMTTGKLRTAGIVYRTNARDKGLMLNHCPWCGAAIQFWVKP